MNSKRSIHFVTAAAVIVVVAIVLISLGHGKSTPAASPPPPPEVQVAVVEQRDLPVLHEWIGTPTDWSTRSNEEEQLPCPTAEPSL